MDDQIQQWKINYEDVFQIQLAEMIFIFRVLNRNEYQEISYLANDECELQEMVCATACLWPTYAFDIGLGGIATALSSAILNESFLQENQAKQLLHYFREEMNSFDAQCDCLIHEAFPEFKLEEISNFTVKKTLYYLSRAEFIVRNLRNIPIQMVEEKEEKEIEPAVQPKKPSLKEELGGFEAAQTMDLKEYPELKWFTHMDAVTGEY